MYKYLKENKDGGASNNNDIKDLCEKLDISEEEELTEIKDAEQIRQIFNSISETVIERIENLAGIHSFDNLTLLDKDLNIRYSNHAFNQKRNHLLYAVFGLPIPNDKEEESIYYNKSVIFPGTKWVFLREYTDTDSSKHSNNINNNCFP